LEDFFRYIWRRCCWRDRDELARFCLLVEPADWEYDMNEDDDQQFARPMQVLFESEEFRADPPLEPSYFNAIPLKSNAGASLAWELAGRSTIGLCASGDP
jgi:hypothetical protein